MNSIDRILGQVAEAEGERTCTVCKKSFKPLGRWDTKCQDCYGKPEKNIAEKMVMILLQVPDDMEDTSADSVLKMLTGQAGQKTPEELAAKEAAAEGQGYGFLKNPQIQG